MKKEKAVAIIQVRMGSSRLPRKALKKIGSKTVLDHIVERLKKARLVERIVVAIADTEKDIQLINYCKQKDYEFFIGSELDVLSRYYEAAKKYKAGIIVRITGDNPFIDPKLVDKLVKLYLKGNYDYISNVYPISGIQTFPIGSSIEVFNFKSLVCSYKYGITKEDKEHVTLYIRCNPQKFRSFYLKARGKLKRPDIRITLDTKDDLVFLRKVFDKLKNKDIFYTKDIIELINKQPALLGINSSHQQKIPLKLKDIRCK